jgi:tetratricopeptide (TPR) repeat protein
MRVDHQILNEINERLSGEIILKESHVQKEFYRVLDNQSIALRCPVHGESILRSLIINEKDHSFHCEYPLCPVHKKGTLFELYCALTRIQVDSALLFWARKFKIDIDNIVKQMEADAENSLQAGNLEAGIAVYQQLSTLFPDNPAYLIKIGDLRAAQKPSEATNWYMGALAQHLKNHDTEAAEKLVLGKLLNGNESDELFTRIADAYLDAKAELELIDLFSRLAAQRTNPHQKKCLLDILVSVEPQNLNLLYSKASLEKESGLLNNSILTYQEILRIQENSRDLASRQETLKILLELQPYSPEWKIRWVMGFFELGETEKGIEELKKAVVIWANDKDFSPAMKLLTQAKKILPDELSLEDTYTDLLIKRGQKSEALNYLRKLAEKTEKENKLDYAIPFYRKYVDLNGDQPEALENLSRLLIQKDQKSEAAKLLERLAAYYFKHNQGKLAIDTYQTILQLEPENQHVRKELAVLLEKQKSASEAVKHYLILFNEAKSAGNIEEMERIGRQILALDKLNTEVLEEFLTLYHARNDQKKEMEFHKRLADIYHHQKNTGKVKSHSRAILAINPYDEVALQHLIAIEKRPARNLLYLRKLGDSYYHGKRFSKALIEYQGLLKQCPDNISLLSRCVKTLESLKASESEIKDAYRDLCLGHLKHNQFPQALENIEAGLVLAPDDFELRDIRLKIIKQQAAANPTRENISLLLEDINNLGNLYLKHKNIPRAVELFEEASSLDPDNSNLHLLLADVYDQNNRSLEAVAHYRKLLEQSLKKDDFKLAEKSALMILASDPYDTELLETLISLYQKAKLSQKVLESLEKLAAVHIDKGETRQAQKALKRILQLAPDHEKAMQQLILTEDRAPREKVYRRRMADYYLLKKDYPKAETLLETLHFELPENYSILRRLETIADNTKIPAPKLFSLYTQIGNVLSKRRQWQEALRYFEKSRELDDTNIETWHNLREIAQVLYLHQKDSEAKNRLLKILSDFGHQLIEMDNLDEAIAVYKQYLEMEPDNLEIHYKLGNLHARLKQFGEALGYYTRVFEGLFDKKDFAKAEKIGKAILEINPDNLETLEKLSHIYGILNQESNYQATLKLLASQYKKTGDTGKLAAIYRKILQAEPDNLEIWLESANIETRRPRKAIILRRLADKYAAKKDYTRAIALYREILELFPGNLSLYLRLIKSLENSNASNDDLRNAYFTIAGILEEKNRLQEAVDYFDTALIIEPDDIPATEHKLDILYQLHLADKKPDSLEVYLAEAVKLNGLYHKFAQWDKSIRLLENLLQMVPVNREIKHLLADTFLKSSQPDKAVQLFFELFDAGLEDNNVPECESLAEKILAIEPANNLILEKLKSLYLQANENNKYIETVFLLAKNHKQQGELAAAILSCRELLAVSPDHLDALRLREEIETRPARKAIWKRKLGDVLAIRKEFDSAAAEYQAALKLLPDNPSLMGRVIRVLESAQTPSDTLKKAYLELADKYASRNDSPRAIELLDKYLVLDPGNLDIREQILNLKESYLSAKKDSQARESFTQEMDTLARDYYTRENYPKAVAWLEKLLQWGGKDDTHLEMLAYSLLVSRNTQKAVIYFKELIDKAISRKNHKYGIQLALDYINVITDDTDIISRLIDLYAASGNREKTIEWLYRMSSIFRDRNDSVTARNYCRQILGISGDEVKAFEYLIETEQKRACKAVWLRKLGDLYLRKKSLPEAMEAYQKALEICPENISLLIRKVSILEKLKVSESTLKDAYAALAESYYNKSLFLKTIEYLDLILLLFPKDLDTIEFKLDALGQQLQIKPDTALKEQFSSLLYDLARLYADQGLYPRALDLLNSLFAENVTNKKLQLEIAELYLKSNNPGKALDYFRQAFDYYLNQNPASTETESAGLRLLELQPDNLDILRQLAELYHLRKDTAKEKEFLGRLLTLYIQQGNTLQSKIMLRRMIRLDKQDTALYAHYLEIEASPHRKVAIYQRLYDLYASSKETGKALSAALDALALFPKNVSLLEKAVTALEKDSAPAEKQIEQLLNLAAVYEARNEFQSSLDTLNRAIKLAPEEYTLLEKKKALLLHWMEKKPGEYELGNYLLYLEELAGIYLKKQEIQNTIALREEIADKTPDNAYNWQNLVSLYQKTAQPDKTLAALHKLAELPEITGNLPKLKIILDQILELQPEDTSILEKRAECEFRENHALEGIRWLKKLASIHASSGLIKETRQVYQRIIDIAVEDGESLLEYAEFLDNRNLKNEAVTLLLERSEFFKQKSMLAVFFKIIARVIEIDPDNVEAYQKLAEIYQAHNKIEDALKAYDRIARIYLEKNETDNAIITYRTALAIAPDNLTLRLGLAELYQKTGNPEEAAAEYRAIAEEFAGVYKWKEAVPYWEEALRLLPEDDELISRTIEGYLATRQFEKAVPLLVKLAGKSEEYGRYEEAARHLKKALEFAPNDFAILDFLVRMLGHDMPTEQDIPYYIKLSGYYSSQNDAGKARSILEEAFGFAPLNSELQEALISEYLRENDTFQAARTCIYTAGLYFEKGKFKEAETFALRHLEYQDDFMEGRQFLVNLYIKMNKIPQAMEGYKAISRIFLSQGNSESAVYSLEKAIQLAPSNMELKEELAEILAKSGRITEAKKQYLDIAKVYQDKKNLDKALMIYRKTIELSPEDITLRLNVLNFARQVQPEQDLIDDYMAIIKLYHLKGDIGNVWRICKEVFRIGAGDPENYITILEYMEICPPSLELGKYYSQLCDYFTKRKYFDYALQAGEKALQLEGSSLKNIENLAVSFKNIQNFEKAKEYYRKLADLYKAQGKANKVMEAYRSILEMDPYDILSHQSYIEAHLEQGLEEEILDDYLALGDAYIHHRDFENALSIFDKVLRIDPTNEKAYEKTMTVGQLQSQPAYPPARETASPPTPAKENSSIASGPIGIIPRIQGDAKNKPDSPLSPQLEAKAESFLRTLELNPNNNQIREKLIEIYAQNNMKKEAIDQLLFLADSYALSNAFKPAVEALQKVLSLNPGHSIAKQKLALYKDKAGIPNGGLGGNHNTPTNGSQSSSAREKEADMISFDDINKDFM